MMKKLYLFFFILFSVLETNAQNVIKVSYHVLYRPTEQTVSPIENDYVLELAGDSSFYTKVKDSLEIARRLDFGDTVFKDFANQRVSFVGLVKSVKYYTTEPMPNFQWECLDGDTIFCGYPCSKARVQYRGRTWNVLYTLDLPYSDGPWKLCGLPGLIMKVVDQKRDFSFSAFKVETVKELIGTFSKKGAKSVTPKEYAEDLVSAYSYEDFSNSKVHIIVDGKEWKPTQKTPCLLEYFDEKIK